LSYPVVLLAAQSTVWLVPLWLLSVGAALGLLVLLIIYGAVRLVSRQRGQWLASTATEGVLQPILATAVLLSALAVIGTVSTIATNPSMWHGIWNSATRVMAVGSYEVNATIPKETLDQPIAVSFRGSELKSIEIVTDQDIYISAEPEAVAKNKAMSVEANDADNPETWRKGRGKQHSFGTHVDTIYVTNERAVPAKVSIHWVTGVEYPEVIIVPETAAALVGLFAIYFLMRLSMPKISAIALATSKEAIAQPLYLVTLVLGAFALVLFIYVPYNTFGEDIKMLKDSGLTMIMVLAIVVALWTSSVSVAEEIEGRTALTVLSKPISRRQFILGKFLGIIWPLALMFILLGLVFLATVSYKVVYDVRETSSNAAAWQDCYLEMAKIVPGLVLAFLETVVLASISVAISTRLPMLPNLVICASIYVLGHLGPLIVNSEVGKEYAMVRFAASLIALVLPVLEHMNIQAAVAAGKDVPIDYLGWAILYCIMYSTVAMLLALALFEDRDLA